MKYQPMPLGRRADPFDDPEWLFELKYDGFRCIARVEFGRCTLYSRNGHPLVSFQDLALQIGNALIPRSAVVDGEIVCLDTEGKPQFYELMSRHGKACFVAFDLLSSNGKDLRHERLLDTKQELRRMISGAPTIIYADHIGQSGIALFEKACELDLEELSPSTSTRLTCGKRTIRRGSRFGTHGTRNGKVGMSYSSARGGANLCRDCIVVN